MTVATSSATRRSDETARTDRHAATKADAPELGAKQAIKNSSCGAGRQLMLSPCSLDVGACPETDGAWKSSEEENGEWKRRKNVRRGFHTKTRRHQPLRDGETRVTSMVSGHVVVDRPQSRERRDRHVKPTPRRDALTEGRKEARFVPLVLEH